MGRDVLYSGGSTIRPVVPYAFSNEEILDVAQMDTGGNAFRGQKPTAEGLNTVYEQKRGVLVADFDPDILLSSIGPIAYYRSKVLGYGGLATEAALVDFYVNASGAGAKVVQITQGANVQTWTYPGGVIAGWVPTAAALTVDDNAEWIPFEVTITSLAGGTLEVRGVKVNYQRTKTALDAGEYTPSNVAGLEITQYAGERPMSSARARDEHLLAEYAYKNRVGQIASGATPAGWLFTAGSAAHAYGTPPDDVVQARFHVKLINWSGVGVSPNITIAGADDVQSVTPVANGWYTLTLAVTPGKPQYFRLYPSGSPTYNPSITSFCGYWMDSGRPGSA
jgi:hypothetical protein